MLSIGSGRLPTGKLKGYHEWKSQQGGGRDTSRAAYDKYCERHAAAMALRLQQKEAAATAEAIAAVEAAKAAEQPLLDKREWTKQQQAAGADHSSKAYDEYVAGWRAAQAAREAAAARGHEEEDESESEEEEELSAEAAAAVAAALKETRREHARGSWGQLFTGASIYKPKAGAAAASGSGAGSSSSSSSSTEAEAAAGLAALRVAPPQQPQPANGKGKGKETKGKGKGKKRASSDKEQLAAAAKAVKNGEPVMRAAKNHGVSRTTLGRWAKAPDPGGCVAGTRFSCWMWAWYDGDTGCVLASSDSIPLPQSKPTQHHTERIKEPGRPPVLELMEEHMVDYITYRYNHGFGMRWSDVQQLARDVASALARTADGDHKQRLLEFEATEKWLKGFRQRHKEALTSRRAQLFQAHRAAMCSESVVQSWVAAHGRLRVPTRGGPGQRRLIFSKFAWF
jgi:hypothetical protein